MTTTCPTAAILQSLLAENLPPDEQQRWTAHLDSCADCQARLEALAAGDVVPQPRGDKAPAPPAEGSPLSRVIRKLKTSIDDTRIGNRSDVPFSLDFLQPSEVAGHLGTFGPYEITSLLGHGGMGIVLGAIDPGLRREVAIKVMLPHGAAQPAARERFLREARAAAAVVHENVVAIHAVDEERGLPYLVMQCIAGGSLQGLLDQSGRLPPAEIARIGAEIAEGLAAAHAKGLVHRDIKPSNILLDGPSRRVKISDFGLAKASDDVSLTRSGTLAGTPEYMAPEQASEGPIDARTDLFALGSVLYAMASGRPPFSGNSAYAVIRQVCEATPRPLAALRSDMPEWLVAIIDRLLKKDPAERFASAAEVAAALRGEKPPLAASPSVRSRQWILAGVAAASLGLMIGSAIWTQPHEEVEPIHPPVALVPKGGGASEKRPESKPTLPPGPIKKPGFYLAGRDEPFNLLHEAVAEAQTDDKIEVQGDGPFIAAPMQIVGKRLTIHAAPGSRPVIESAGGAETPNRSFIETDSNLTLIGLDIRWNSTPRRLSDNETEEVVPHTALAIRAGFLLLADCRFSVAGGNCVAGMFGGSCLIENSLLSSANGPTVVVQMRPGEEVVVHNSILTGRTGIGAWIDDASTGGGQTSIRLSRTTVSAPFLLQCFAVGTTAAELPTSDTPRLHCEAIGCVFDATTILALRPAPLPAGAPARPLRNLGRLTNQATWTGHQNVFSGVETYVVVARGGRPPIRMTATFDDWKTRTNSDTSSLAATAQFASPGARREPSDFALIAVPGLKPEELKSRGAEVEKVGVGKDAHIQQKSIGTEMGSRGEE